MLNQSINLTLYFMLLRIGLLQVTKKNNDEFNAFGNDMSYRLRV